MQSLNSQLIQINIIFQPLYFYTTKAIYPLYTYTVSNKYIKLMRSPKSQVQQSKLLQEVLFQLTFMKSTNLYLHSAVKITENRKKKTNAYGIKGSKSHRLAPKRIPFKSTKIQMQLTHKAK